MPVSEEFRLLVLDQLGAVRPVATRRMFGGLGLYAGDLFFALVDDDVLYFKVDDETRPEFEAAGSQPFVPFEGSTTMGYWTVPPDVFEDVERLEVWMKNAIDVAARARKKKKVARPGRSRRS